ncbi:MAG: efflux RND transporter periplasmic adaptor subunit [Gammaproteobacteria bacterium]
MRVKIPFRLALFIAVVLLLGTYIWLSTKPEAPAGHMKKGQMPKTFVVKTEQPQLKAIPITLEEVGTVEAEQTVTLVSQITGILKNIAFQPGKKVEQGQLLFELDPSVFIVSLKQAQANLQRDNAQLALLEGNSQRYQALAKLEYVTRQQADEAVAAAEAQKAVIAADQALVEQANIQLGYTQIRAPITGKSGTVNVHPGDSITANVTPLVVINRMNPLQVSFSISQNKLSDVLKYKRHNTLMVEVLGENQQQLAQGQLTYLNNTVDPQTGAVQAKARVANVDHRLWPGQLVTVRIILSIEKNALVIPDKAIQMGQQGNYVYVVKQNKAVIQPITVERQLNQDAVISQGLDIKSVVITEIPPGLTEGTTVTIQ